jgi:hypothetical protein
MPLPSDEENIGLNPSGYFKKNQELLREMQQMFKNNEVF